MTKQTLISHPDSRREVRLDRVLSHSWLVLVTREAFDALNVFHNGSQSRVPAADRDVTVRCATRRRAVELVSEARALMAAKTGIDRAVAWPKW